MENDFEVEVFGNKLKVEKRDMVISMEIGYVSEDRREGRGHSVFMAHPNDELENRVGHIDMVNFTEDSHVKHYYQSSPPLDSRETCFIRTSKVEFSDESDMEDNVEIWLTKESLKKYLKK